MKKKAIKLAAIGFPLGIAVGVFIMFLTTPQTGEAPLHAAETLRQRMGTEQAAFLVQMLCSGLLGAVSMGSSICYDIESWSLVRAVLTHWALIMISYFAAALFCGWCQPAPGEILLMSGIMTAVYLIIFGIMYLRYRREAEELNLQIKNKK